MTAFSFKDEFSVLKCLKTFKINFFSPELIALRLIAVGLFDTRDFIYFPFYLLENAFNSFSLLRLLNGLVFIEVVQTQTAISAFRAMLINYIYFPLIFKSHTMQCISAIINSQRHFNLEKSEYVVQGLKVECTFNF